MLGIQRIVEGVCGLHAWYSAYNGSVWGKVNGSSDYLSLDPGIGVGSTHGLPPTTVRPSRPLYFTLNVIESILIGELKGRIYVVDNIYK